MSTDEGAARGRGDGTRVTPAATVPAEPESPDPESARESTAPESTDAESTESEPAESEPVAPEWAEPEGTAAAVVDADGTIAGWTQGAQRLLGYEPEEVLGRPFADLLAPTGAPQLCHRRGHRLEGELRISRLAARDGAPRWLAAFDPHPDARRRLASERLALLSEASTRIGTTLDVMQTGQELADFAVPRLADYVTVDLVDSVFLGEEPLARLGRDAGRVPVFRRAGVASIHEGIPESLWDRGEPVFVPPASPFTTVLTTGRSFLEPMLRRSLGTWLRCDPQRTRVIRTTDMHTVMMVPIKARGVVLGIAVFVRTDNPAPFEQDDLVLAEELVDRAALSLDNAHRYTREHIAALALQRNLLPPRLSGGPALEVSSRYLPADLDHGVGGDWYDVIALPGDRVALVVGDVVGHGIQAAAAMGRLRTALRTLADQDLPPVELLTRLDRTVGRLTQEDADTPGATVSGVGATCLYIVYDPAGRLVDIAGAGHPPPVVVSPAGRATVTEIPSGVPIGLGLGHFESVRIAIPDGSLIALYTDGLVEFPTEDIESGICRLAAALAHPALPLEELCDRAVAARRTPSPSDDATLLLARTGPTGTH
ncbi:SpoIIE family protein phosphatase [Streptomyces sp. NPDC001185]|uniref:SpoIIE family protein phosphatase n=1 Tax=Streptomyces sp. NPDC001185 TaxID=3154380 RepID=UPI00332B3454